MTYESMRNEIDCFIEDQLYDMETYPDCYLQEDIEHNTKFLESLDDKDLEKINNMIMGDEHLNSVLNETIKWYLYHYNKEVN